MWLVSVCRVFELGLLGVGGWVELFEVGWCVSVWLQGDFFVVDVCVVVVDIGIMVVLGDFGVLFWRFVWLCIIGLFLCLCFL